MGSELVSFTKHFESLNMKIREIYGISQAFSAICNLSFVFKLYG